MGYARVATGERRTSAHWQACFCALASVTALVIVTGCSYATVTQAPRLSGPLARAADSAMMASVDIGYAPQPRATITGAVSSLSLEHATRGPQGRSLVNLLQGRLPGLLVEPALSGGVSMRVRGGGGDFGASPLVVVDGDPLPAGTALESFLAAINPDDVVRVDVLKDVSSTAIYGTRGSSGVVLITLRHKAQ